MASHISTLHALYTAMEADNVTDTVLTHLRHALDALGDDSLLTAKEHGEKFRAFRNARLQKMMAPKSDPKAYDIVSVDWSICLESFPCQHYCKVRFPDGSQKTMRLSAPEIKERFMWKQH